MLEALAYLGHPPLVPGAPPEAMVRTGAESAIVRAELDNRDSPALVEAQILPAGRSRTRVNRKAVNGRRELGAAAPVHDLLARGSRHRQRRPEGAARGARRRAGPARRRRGPGRRRDRPGAAPARRPPAPIGRPGRRGGGRDPRRVGPAPGRRRQGAGGGPRTAGGGPRPAGGAGLQPPGRRGGHADRSSRASATCAAGTGDLLDALGGLAGATTCAGASTRSARTATTCSSRSRGARPAPTPRRANSAAWPWPCAWACTSWSAPGRR